jgi:hypothetical protein
MEGKSLLRVVLKLDQRYVVELEQNRYKLQDKGNLSGCFHDLMFGWISRQKLRFPPYLCPRLFRPSEGKPKIVKSGYQVFQGNLLILV